MGQFVAATLQILFSVLSWLIIIRILMSWFRGAQGVPGGHFIADITEPILGFFRRMIPPVSGIDLSPLWAVLVLDILRSALHGFSGL